MKIAIRLIIIYIKNNPTISNNPIKYKQKNSNRNFKGITKEQFSYDLKTKNNFII